MTDTELCIPCRMKKWAGILQEAAALQLWPAISTPALRDELKHTFWLLNRVNSAEALARKLSRHPVFKDYKVILAAGNGQIDDAEENQKSFDKVVDAMLEAENPGCFDRPDKTFIDLYMKSGLYITERYRISTRARRA